MERLYVKVTPEHQERHQAERRKIAYGPLAETCPVAQALTDKGYTGVLVNGDNAYIEGRWYNLSKPLRKAIQDYDEGHFKGPFRFGTYALTR